MQKRYFNIDRITDTNLIENFLPKAKLNPENNRILRPIYVDFEDAGYEGNEASCPKALNVRLAKGKD